jgi:hypothetical protein
MYVSINTKLVSFQNCNDILSRFGRERVVRRVLISNVPAGNLTLCHVQHVARDLRLEQF